MTAISPLIGGRGGGRKWKAQASGSNTEQLEEAVKVAREYVDNNTQ